MQARKQNSNNAKDKLKLFETLQTQRKANEEKRKHRKFIFKINGIPSKKESKRRNNQYKDTTDDTIVQTTKSNVYDFIIHTTTNKQSP